MSLIGSLKNTISECNIGDWIKIGYKASENSVGSFFDPLNSTPELHVSRKTTSRWFVQGGDGNNNSDLYYLPAVSPNGSFNAVCIKITNKAKIFLPDRIIQTYINYNNCNSSGLIDGSYKIVTGKYIGTAQIMDYDTIQEIVPILESISSDYRYDLGIPALSFTIGGGNNSTWRYAFNTYDNVTQTTNIEMTRTLNGDNVRYVADYAGQYDSTRLCVGEEHYNIYGELLVYHEKSYLQKYTGDNYRISVYYRSAIRPLLYLKDNGNPLYQYNNDTYGIIKTEEGEEK